MIEPTTRISRNPGRRLPHAGGGAGRRAPAPAVGRLPRAQRLRLRGVEAARAGADVPEPGDGCPGRGRGCARPARGRTCPRSSSSLREPRPCSPCTPPYSGGIVSSTRPALRRESSCPYQTSSGSSVSKLNVPAHSGMFLTSYGRRVPPGGPPSALVRGAVAHEQAAGAGRRQVAALDQPGCRHRRQQHRRRAPRPRPRSAPAAARLERQPHRRGRTQKAASDSAARPTQGPNGCMPSTRQAW